MKTLFIENEIKYIGSQLAPHWIYKNFKIQGDAIFAFVGECEGLNILSDGAPIPVSGLGSDLGIEDIKEFAQEIMQKYSDEIEDIILASTKVRGV